MIQNQFARRNLTPFQRAELALTMESIFSERAKENQLSALKQNTVKVNSPERLDPINTRQELSNIAGVGEQSIQRAKKVADKADEPTKEKLQYF